MTAYGYHIETQQIIKSLNDELTLVKGQRNESNRKIEELFDTIAKLKLERNYYETLSGILRNALDYGTQGDYEDMKAQAHYEVYGDTCYCSSC